MASPLDDVLPPTADNVAAGLDLTRTATPADITEQGAIDAAASRNEAHAIDRANANADLGLWHYTKDIAKETLTGTLVDNAAGALFERDPAFSHDAFKERFKAAQESLPETYWSSLDGAVSADHFDFLYGRAQSHVEAQKELGTLGWGGTSANILAQFLDPASLAIGVGTGSLAIKAAQALKLARTGQVAANAVGGALGGVSIEATRGEEGLPTSTENYLLATGLGLSLGALFGPLGRNPAVAREAAALHQAGEQLKALGEAQLALPPPMKQLTYAGVKRAEEEASVIRVPPEPGQAPAPPEAVIHAPAPEKPSAVHQAIDDVHAALSGENVDPIPSVQKAVQETLGTAPAEKAAATSKPSAGLVHDDPVAAADKMTEMAAPKLSRDRQRIREQRMGFEEFRRQQQANKPKGSGALAEAAPLPGKLGADPEGYTFRSSVYKRMDDGTNPNEKVFSAHKIGDEAGEELGYIEMTKQDDGRWVVTMLEVPEHARKSPSAYGLLLVAQKEMEGQAIIPDSTLLKDGFDHWAGRLPWVKEAYRPAPEKPGYAWLSPRKLLENRESIINDIRTATGNKLGKLTATLKSYDETIATVPPKYFEPENLASQSAALRDPLARHVLKAGAREAVNEVLDRILPASVRGVVRDEIASNGALDGLYRDRVVYVALNAANPIGIAYHEVGHALKQLGMFADDEWAQLVAHAEKIGARKRYRIDERYQHDAITPAQIEEEAVMHMLADRLQGKTFGTADAILDKTVRLLRQIRDALGVKGFRTTQDLFDDIKSGRISQRADVADDAGDAMSAVGAQRNNAVTHDFLQDPDWKSLQEGNVPRSGGFWRFDRAGISAQSENVPERLIGPSLLNDSVGKSDHSLNPFSADQDYRKLMNQWMAEYDKTRRPAFSEWADDLGLSPIARVTREHEFFEQTGHYIRDTTRRPGDYHPAVERFGNKIAALQKDVLENLKNPLRQEGLVGRPVLGAQWVPEDLNYLWRKFSPDKVNGALSHEAFGQTGTLKMIQGAMRSAQPGIDDALLERLSQGYLMNVRSRAAGLGDEWSLAMAQGDFQRFRAILMDEAGARLTPQEADDIIARLNGGGRQTEGDLSTLKRRVLIDETYVERQMPFGQNGETRDHAFSDLLETNVNNLFEHYARKAAGRVALGRVRVRHPDGSMLIDGINSDAEIDSILRQTQQWGVDRGQLDSSAQAVTRLRFAFDRILGVPDKTQTGDYADWMRLGRKLMSTRLMGQVGIAQLGESGTAVGALGVQAIFRHMPAFRRIIDAAGDLRNSNPLFEELEAMGIGAERLHGLHFHNLDEVGQVPFGVAEKSLMDRATNLAGIAERGTYEASGMSFIQQRQEMWVAANMASKIANIGNKLRAGKGLGRSDRQRLAQLNIDEPMLARIMSEMGTHSDITEGAFFGRKVNRLNGQNWTDLEARIALENALFRTTRKIIQAGDEGSSAHWMSGPTAQSIFQFRGFTFTAWANQFQYNIHMGDPTALATFVASVAWNAAVRGAQIKVLAAARSDGTKYEEKYLTPWELGKAGFQRAGWTSIIPMGVDTGLTFAGQPGMFNARSTGQSSDIVFGSPITSFIDNAAKGIGGTVNSLAAGRKPSQAEIRNLAGLAPFSNLMPVSVGLNYLIQDLPERSPKRAVN